MNISVICQIFLRFFHPEKKHSGLARTRFLFPDEGYGPQQINTETQTSVFVVLEQDDLINCQREWNRYKTAQKPVAHVHRYVKTSVEPICTKAINL